MSFPVPDWKRLQRDKDVQALFACEKFYAKRKDILHSLRTSRSHDVLLHNQGSLDVLDWVERLIDQEVQLLAKQEQKVEEDQRSRFDRIRRLRFGTGG